MAKVERHNVVAFRPCRIPFAYCVFYFVLLRYAINTDGEHAREHNHPHPHPYLPAPTKSTPTQSSW